MKLLALVLVVATLICSCNLYAQYRPDLAGVGPASFATGGRGGAIFVIDTTTDASWSDGAGVASGAYGDSAYTRCSLRYFVSTATGARIGLIATTGVVEATGGVMNATSGNWSLYGQTSGGKFVVKKDKINIRDGSDNVIVMHYNAFTDTTGTDCEREGFQIEVAAAGATDLVRIIIDHYTGLWGTDDNFDIRNQNPDARKVDSIFIYQSLFAQAINLLADYGCETHSYNLATGVQYTVGDISNNDYGINKVVIFQNVLAHALARNPLMNGFMSFVNNIVFNPASRAAYLRNEPVPLSMGPPVIWDANPRPTDFNIVNNSFQAGRSTPAGAVPLRFGITSADTLAATAQVYMSGNIDDFSIVPFYTDSSTQKNHVAGAARNGLAEYNLPVLPAEALSGFLLDKVGASPLYRTTQETNIINDVRDSTGTASSDGTGMVNSVANVLSPSYVTGGYPVIATTKNTFTFPANPNTLAANGLTNLENWIHYNFTVKVEGGSDKTLILDND